MQRKQKIIIGAVVCSLVAIVIAIVVGVVASRKSANAGSDSLPRTGPSQTPRFKLVSRVNPTKGLKFDMVTPTSSDGANLVPVDQADVVTLVACPSGQCTTPGSDHPPMHNGPYIVMRDETYALGTLTGDYWRYGWVKRADNILDPANATRNPGSLTYLWSADILPDGTVVLRHRAGERGLVDPINGANGGKPFSYQVVASPAYNDDFYWSLVRV